MWLTRSFLKRPTLVFVLIALTFLAAIMALRTLVVQQQPNNGLPAISITASDPGASTTELVTEVAEPIEDRLAGTPYLDHTDTTIESGQVSITATFTLQSTDTENVANVEGALQQAERQLPSTIPAPTIRIANPSEPVVVTLALVSSHYAETDLAALANNSIVPVLEQLPGVSNVNVAGTTQPAFMVTVNPQALAADNLTLTDVINAISPNNERVPGGYVYQPGRETALDIRGDLPDPQSVAQLPIHVNYSGTSTGSASGGSGTGAATASSGAGSSAPAPLSPMTSSNAVAAGASPIATSGASAAPTTSGTGFAAPAASSVTTSGTATTTTTSTTASGASTSNAATSVTIPVDQALTPQSINSNTTATSAVGSPALPSGSASTYGSGAGVTTTPYVGALPTWAVPSADKRISDVATVLNSSVVQRVFGSQNGKPGVTLFIQKQTTASEVTVGDEVVGALPALRRQFPGVDFQVAHVQATYTEQQVQSVEHTLIEGIVLTAIVMLFFLASWRNALVVMIAIPTSLGVTLFVMKMLNLTLDTVSLMAMTLVIGVLIDDSTVVLENVERHHANGEAPPDAALNGRSEIGLAAIVITMVDVVVFLPIAFAGGEVGQVLTEFAIVIVIATLTSLFVSFTITPTLAGLWSMKSNWRPWPAVRWFTARFEGLRTRYAERWLPAAFARPWPIVIGSAILCVLAYLLVPTGLIGEEYIPSGDQGTIFVQVTKPAGYPLSDMVALMGKMEAETKSVVTQHDLQYETTITGAYSAAFGGFVQEGNVGQISIYLNDDRSTSTYQYVNLLEQRLPRIDPSAAISVAAATQQGGGNQQQIDEEVGTANGADPTPYAARIFAALQQAPGVTGAQNSATNASPQMEVDFNRVALQSLDVSTGTAAEAVEAAFGGYVASQIETPDKGLTDIEVIYPSSQQTSLADVLSIPIASQSGGIVRVGDVASLKWAPAPLVITRENRQTIIHVTANVAPGYSLSDVTRSFLGRVRGLHLPGNVSIHPAALGQQDLMGQALVTIAVSLMISILLVFLMIVALYNSYRTPFVTLFAIPLAAIGAMGALWITHSTLNLYSLIGTVLLVGLVTKNGILLVDYADTVRLRGASREDGIREAARTRFRPIVMTTVAMVAGMTPLALGLEPGGQTRASLAIVVIGGLLSSLFLTLFIVPIMYRWIAPAQLAEETRFADERPAGGRPRPA